MLNAWRATGDAGTGDEVIGGSSGGGSGAGGDALERGLGEEGEVGGPGAFEAGADVGGDLGRGERPQAHAERDPLAKLSERRVGELRLELGLPGEEDLEDLLACRLEVRQQA